MKIHTIHEPPHQCPLPLFQKKHSSVWEIIILVLTNLTNRFALRELMREGGRDGKEAGNRAMATEHQFNLQSTCGHQTHYS